jgi:hypothetical protein
LTAKIVEHIPDFDSTNPQWSSLPEVMKLYDVCSVLENDERFSIEWMSQSAERIYWQHPVRKWWVSVMIKRGMVENERMKTVYINWHTPKED